MILLRPTNSELFTGVASYGGTATISGSYTAFSLLLSLSVKFAYILFRYHMGIFLFISDKGEGFQSMFPALFHFFIHDLTVPFHQRLINGNHSLRRLSVQLVLVGRFFRLDILPVPLQRASPDKQIYHLRFNSHASAI